MKCKPLEAKKAIFIIDDADKMNDYSTNAFLKVLEEPTESNVLILINDQARIHCGQRLFLVASTCALTRCALIPWQKFLSIE